MFPEPSTGMWKQVEALLSLPQPDGPWLVGLTCHNQKEMRWREFGWRLLHAAEGFEDRVAGAKVERVGWGVVDGMLPPQS
jgi:hypothetical protein